LYHYHHRRNSLRITGRWHQLAQNIPAMSLPVPELA